MAVNTILSLIPAHWIDVLPDNWSLSQFISSIFGLLKLSDWIFSLFMLGLTMLFFFSGKVKHGGEGSELNLPAETDPAAIAAKRRKLAFAKLLKGLADISKTIPAYLGEHTHDPSKPLPKGKSPDVVYAEEGSTLLFGYSTLYWLIAFFLSLVFPFNNLTMLLTFIIPPVAVLCLLAIFATKQQNNVGMIIYKIKGIFQGRASEPQNTLPEDHSPAETPIVQHPPEGGKEQA